MKCDELTSFIKDILHAHCGADQAGYNKALLALTINIIGMLKVGEIPIDEYVAYLRDIEKFAPPKVTKCA